jgi:excisionase family DNA binding protein
MAARVDCTETPIARLLRELWWSRKWSVAYIRVSANNREKLKRNGEAATSQVLASHPAVARVREVGGVSALMEDAALRERLGLIEIRRRDVSPYAEAPDRLMGYLWIVEEVGGAIILISDSAGEFNVHVPGTLLPDNAAMLLLQSFLLMPNVTELHSARWDRIVREKRFGASVVAAAQLGSTVVYCDGRKADLYTIAGQLAADLNNTTAASARVTGKDVMVGGVLGRLQLSEMEWPYSRFLTPPSYRIRMKGPVDVVKRRMLLVPDVDHTDAWREFYLAVGRGETWASCAAILAAERVPDRGQRLAHKTWAELTKHQAERAARTAASLENIEKLRTRTLMKRVRLGEACDPEKPFWRGLPVVQDDSPYGSVNVEVALPDHGLGLTDDEWQACLHRVERRTSRVPVGDRPTSIASALEQWDDGHRQYKIHTLSDYYHLRSRDIADGFDEWGDKRGWYTNEGRLDASFSKVVFDRALANLVMVGGQSLECDGAVFSTPPPRDVVEDSQRDLKRTALERALTEAEEELDVRRLAREHATDDTRGRRQALLGEAEAAVAAASEAIVAFDTRVARRTVTRSAELDLSDFAGLLACIEKYAGRTAPRAVNDAVKAMFGTSLRVTLEPGNELVARLTVDLQAPDQDGRTVLVHAEAILRNARIGERANHDRAEVAAGLVLRDGHTFEQARDLLRTKASQKFGDSIRRWLSRKFGVGTTEAAGMLDCPLPEVRADMWAILNGNEPRCDARLAEAIQAQYLGIKRRGRGAWAQPQEAQRRILTALELADGRGANLAAGTTASDLARASGLLASQVLQHMGERSRPFSRLLCRHPADPRAATPWRHEPCGEWLLHVMLVRETSHCSGLICPTCGTTADGIPLPAGYFTQYDCQEWIDGELACRTVEVSADAYNVSAPAGPVVRRVAIREAAALTGIPAHQLREATNSGELPCVRRGRLRERWFDPGELERFRASRQRDDSRLVGAAIVPDDYYTLQDAADHIGVKLYALRRLVTGRDQTAILRHARMTVDGRANTIVVNRSDVEALDLTWVEAHRTGRILIGEACSITGLTQARIRLLMAQGRVPHLRTPGGTATFDPEELKAWLDEADGAAVGITTRAAAALARVSEEAVRRAVKRGDLPAARTGGGHARFDPDAVSTWASRRGTPPPPHRVA